MAWFNSSWGFRKQITLDSSQVPANQTDFPVLISITDSDLMANAQSDGDDIVFTSSDETTQIAHEIETYDNSDGSLVAWVLVSSLSASSDTVLYMYYGNSGAANQEDASTLWADYGAVCHLSEDPSGDAPQMADSTGNGNDGTSQGTMTSDDLITGQINGGLALDGSDDYIDCGNDSSLDTGATLTVSMWVKMASAMGNGIIIGKVDGELTDGWAIQIVSQDIFYYKNDSNASSFSNSNVVDDTDWHYLAATSNGGGTDLVYWDGVNVRDSGTGNSDNLDSTNSLKIGAIPSGTFQNFTEGSVDELRVTDSVRSANWLLTEFRNQNDPSGFHTFAAQVAQGPTPSHTYQHQSYNAAFYRSWSV